MNGEEVEALRTKLAKKEEANQKLKANLALLKEKTQNTIQVFEKLKETKASLKEEQARRAMAEEALTAQRQEVARAQAAAAAAAESARSAQAQATAAAKAADGARADAAAARQQLSAMQAQLQLLQALCDGMQAQVAGSAAAAAQAQQLPGQDAAALRSQLEALQAEQAAMQQQLQRWQAALTPFAVAAAGLAGGAAGAAAAAAAAPAPPAAVPALLAPASAPAAALAPAVAQGRRRGGVAAGGGAAGGGTAGGTAAPTSPRQPRGKGVRHKEQQQREAGEAEAQRRVALLAAAPAEKPEDVRARAVAARQAAAAAGAAGLGAKRPRTGPDGFGAAPAQVDVLAEALALPSKRARQTAPDAVGAAGGVASPRTRPNPQQQQRGAPGIAPTAAAAAAPAGEASLAISANELAVEQQKEHLTAADEAAQLLGRITAGTGVGGSISQKDVHAVAAQLQLMHAKQRLPLPLLLACFETAILECAAPKPQAHNLQLVTAVLHDGQPKALPARHATPEGWFEQQQQQQAGSPASAEDSDSMPFAAVWCSREALTSHRLHWLLHCAIRVQQLQEQYAAAQAASRGQTPSQLTGFAGALQQHLHRLVVCCCLAGSPQGSITGRKRSSSAPRHTETELCALAAAAAGLYRWAGDLRACWALLLDLLAIAAPASSLLPPLAAVLDVWPRLLEAVQPAAGDGGVGTASERPAGVHAILQHLCALAAIEEGHAAEEQHAAAAAAGSAGDAPPPLLLERQPVAAAEFLRRLGQQRWDWAPDAAGSADAWRDLRAALQQEPGVAAAMATAMAAKAGPAARPLAGPAQHLEPAAAPAAAGPAAGVQSSAEAADRVLQDGQVEEL